MNSLRQEEGAETCSRCRTFQDTRDGFSGMPPEAPSYLSLLPWHGMELGQDSWLPYLSSVNGEREILARSSYLAISEVLGIQEPFGR